MLPRSARLTAAALTIAALAGCANYTAVEPAKLAVKDTLAVEPSLRWNRSSGALAPAGPREVWTVDGNLLHQINFVTGIADGEPLVPKLAGNGDKAPPEFRSAMAADQIAALFEASRVYQLQGGVFTVRAVKPQPFLGGEGVRIEYVMAGKDNIDREGLAVGSVKDGKLYMIYYEGTKLYHFPQYLPEVERVIAGARLTKA